LKFSRLTESLFAKFNRLINLQQTASMAASADDGVPTKRPRLSQESTENGDTRRTIGTHNGCFHCDEVAACFMLKQLPQYRSAIVKRSRDPAVLKDCDVVVDVGGVFDPKILRFDHHQRDFNETFNSLMPEKPWKIKLSSAGLVYCHFGLEVIASLTGLATDDDFVKKAFDLMYENFIMEIDAIDNGLKQYPNATEQPLYTVHTGLSARVGHLNPWWNATDGEPEDTLFAKAMELVGTEFRDRLSYYKDCWWPARKLVASAFAKCTSYDPKGRILVLDSVPSGGLPWKSHLYELERQADCLGQVLFALYKDNNGNWRVQAVPPDETRGFENRLALLADWRGLRDDELNKVSGIDGCVFVHSSGFIGGNRSFDGALEMARKTIQMQDGAA
ncbi:hypothetical protein BOX15_Mlig029752g2, partial [Macrostomum lignano]